MSINLRLAGARGSWKPGETLEVEVAWSADQPVEEVEARLLWRTEGRGDEEDGVVASERWPTTGTSGDRELQFTLPTGPWSYQGELLTIQWLVDAVLWPSGEQTQVEITLSPTGEAVRPLLHETVEEVIERMPEGRSQSLVSWLARLAEKQSSK